MNGGNGDKSGREKASERQFNQRIILDSLRLAYIFSPLRLEELFRSTSSRNITPEIVCMLLASHYSGKYSGRKLAKSISKNKRVIEIKEIGGTLNFTLENHFKIQRHFKSDYEECASFAGIPTSEDKRRLVESQYIPKNVTLPHYVRGNRQSYKSFGAFLKYIQKVILFQNFELVREFGRDRLFQTHLSKADRMSYKDYSIAQSLKNKFNLIIERPVPFRKNNRRNPALDKELAKILFGNKGKKALDNIRQTRKRMRKINLL